ncbi:MAG: YdcF family protein [Planctomycetes bacterium]|nr:YdcF family protein [Planctomycetota bacterium]
MTDAPLSSHHSPVTDDDLRLARRLWDWQAAEDVLTPADAALGLGSYDVRVADRCVELFNAGLVKLVCFSGGSGNFTAGRFPRGEAQAFAERAVMLGLPESALIIEPTATNTAENLTRSRPLLESHGVRSLILVAKPNMLLRGQVTAAAQWPEVRTLRAGARVPFAADLAPGRTVADLIHELVGDAERLRLYPERGWHAPVSIPADVAAAVRTLIACGYDRHLPQ